MFKINTSIIMFLIFSAALLYPMSGKPEYAPFKPSVNLSIEDGEFLHYVQTVGGEKNLDIYFAVRIISSNGNFARIYQKGIRSSKESLPQNYTDYPVNYLISLDKGSLSESEGTYDTNRNRENEPSSFNDKYYWHYIINDSEHLFEAENRFWNGYEIKARKERMRIKPGYPVWDMISGSFFGPRFMDISGPGIMYYIMPEFLKEPLPVYYKTLGKEKITSKAGTFNTVKIAFMAADPFLGKLMDSMARDTYLWIEDSGRKLVVKFQSMKYVMTIDEISNINAGKHKTK